MHAAKEAGADAIKLQTYTADTLTLKSNKEVFRISGGTIWDGRTLYDLYEEAYTPWDWQPKLKAVANEIGLDCFSSAFDPTSVDFLEKMDVPAYKVASPEIVDLPLIRKIARTQKPLIISTGMASLAEIDEAVRTAREAGASQIALLKCTSSYPALPSEMNLMTIPNMSHSFDLPVGLSDHTLGIAIPVAAVALGACIIEKHLTLSRKDGGPDSEFSSEPHEFKFMVESIRAVEQALGKVSYDVSGREAAEKSFRRSLFATKYIAKGESYTYENIRSIRPAQGLPPKFLDEIIGRRANRDITPGTPLTWDLVS